MWKCESFKKNNLNILFIADTHNCLRNDNETLKYIKAHNNYDCCILLGDHSASDLEEILNIVPFNKIYGVLGNHDSWDNKAFTEDRHNPAHDGLKRITEYIYKNHVALHIHGHIHEESEEILKNATRSICLYMAKFIEL